MRPEPNLRIEPYRAVHPTLGESPAGSDFGYFERGVLRIISSGVDTKHGWEHVSVSVRDRLPTWEEMRDVKDMFWREEETVLQFHPMKSKYVNKHPYVLHLWKKIGVDHELPPAECV